MCRSVGSSANMSATRRLVDLCLEVTGSKLDREVDASVSLFDLGLTEAPVSYTHLTLPTILLV